MSEPEKRTVVVRLTPREQSDPVALLKAVRQACLQANVVLRTGTPPGAAENAGSETACLDPDPLDLKRRVDELKLLTDGWLDGEGVAPPAAVLDWTSTAFAERYPDDLRLPYLFPTPAGRVLAEWSLAPWSLSLEIDTVAKRGYWHALNLETDEEAEKELDLASVEDWKWLAEQVRSAGRDSQPAPVIVNREP
jgi:hypothetical protein